MIYKKLLLSTLITLSIFACLAKSETVVLHPIFSALDIAEREFIGSKNTWITYNDMQEEFIKKYWPYKNEISNFSGNELKAVASFRDVTKVNEFLKNNGFTIQLEPGDDFYMASVLKILCKWITAGIATEIAVKDKIYPAISMETGEQNFSIVKSKNYNQPIIILETQNKDKVYITKADQQLTDFELLDHISAIKTDTIKITQDFDGITFPMVNLDTQTDVNWLLKMGKNGYWISQALQQTRFQMNEEGAAAQSAVALGFEKCCIVRPTLIIDEPFYLWIERPNMHLPIFAGYIDIEDWKKPEKLGN